MDVIDKIGIKKLKKDLISQGIVLVICGPTATGKTQVALNLANLMDTDVISFDSMQLYRGLDIGTDKYKKGDFPTVRQYMVDIFDPSDEVTVMDFRNICRKQIDAFLLSKRIPILAGGSGLYLRSVIDNLDFVEDATGYNSRQREKIKKDITIKGIQVVYQKLKEIDPEYAKKISVNDEKRIIRALEVYYTTGKKFSSFHMDIKKRAAIYKLILIGLTADRDYLYRKIEKRVDSMIESGLIDEVITLKDKGFDRYNSMKQAVGYKEILKYLYGKSNSLDETISLIKRNTRRLAKKQLTWFKEDKRINWIRADEYDNILDLVKAIIEIIRSKV